MPFTDPEADMLAIGPLSQAILGTLAANVERTERQGSTLTEEEISPAEIHLAAWLITHGIPGFVQQHRFAQYAADFYWPTHGLVVEVDGRDYHHDLTRERRRDKVILATGARKIIHLPAGRVFRETDWAIGSIAAWLERITAEQAAKEPAAA